MSVIKIRGGVPLKGEVAVHGAKNAVLPILASSVINGGESIIHNCPDLTDVRVSLDILKHLGCDVRFENGTVTVNSSDLNCTSIPDELMQSMRSSVIFAGALLSRMRSVQFSYPGGCNLGHRPIDLHLNAFNKLGIITQEEHGKILCRGENMQPAQVFLQFPSVGATENIMLAACCLKGVTTIINAAREPEIVDLQNFLNSMGACVRGAGTDIIEITGTDKLHNCEYTVMPDRIVASTYMAAVVTAGGNIKIKNVIPNHISAFIAVMRECGASVTVRNRDIFISAPKYIRPVKLINTLPYPGFPTDAQSLVMTVMSLAKGTGIIRENVFQGRYSHANELIRMGADISIADKIAVVRGVRSLSGCAVEAADLRSGAALAVAALSAEGETSIYNVHYIDRGYENFDKTLASLGADIERVDDSE